MRGAIVQSLEDQSRALRVAQPECRPAAGDVRLRELLKRAPVQMTIAAKRVLSEASVHELRRQRQAPFGLGLCGTLQRFHG
jgi:hypothetical protein